MIKYYIYHTQTGAIIQTGTAREETDIVTMTGFFENAAYGLGSFAPGEDYYVSEGEVTPRPIQIQAGDRAAAANGVEEVVISTIPDAEIVMDGISYLIEDGEIVLTSDAPRQVIIEVPERFPYKPQTVKVEFN